MTIPPVADPRPAQAGLVVSGVVDYPDGISSIDTLYVRPALDASHLVVHGGRAAFVDTGTTQSVPQLLAALDSKGIARSAVDWVFLTHIHLDHAGGAGALLRLLPNARAVVHPRGAAHLVDPTKLIAATRQVYGDAVYERLYGELVPIPSERLVVTDDGMTLELAGRSFRFLHTPGHALHHQVIHDPAAGAVFTGDAFGFSYRPFDVGGRAFILPTTTPTQFDPDQFHASIDRILMLDPACAYLTHYSRVTDIARLAGDLHAGVRAFVTMTRELGGVPDREQRLQEALFGWASAALDDHGYAGDLATRHAILDADLGLNVQGLLVWLDRRA